MLKELARICRGKLWRGRSAFTNRREEYSGFDIGDWTYGSPEILKWNEDTTLRIGKFCSIAKGVRILLGGEHHVDWVTTYPLGLLFEDDHEILKKPATKGNITIGNDVWLGVNVTILSGVTIGDGAVIGAGSVVTRDIPAYTIAAGCPAKPIRRRFDDAVIQALLATKWWDWPLGQIREAAACLLSPDLDAFLARYDPRRDQNGRYRPGQTGRQA